MTAPTVMLALTGCPEPEIDDVPAPTLSEAITQEALMGHLTTLASIAEANGGTRMGMSQGYVDSADYIQTQLEDAGYTVTVNEFTFVTFDLESAEVSVVSDGPADLTTLDILAMRFSGSGAVETGFTAVDVMIPAASDPNTSTSGCEASDFDGFPVGNIALIQRGTCPFHLKAVNAADAGASAVLIFNEGQEERRETLDGFIEPTGVSVPVVGLSYAEGTALVGTPDAILSVEVVAETANPVDHNLIAETPGGDATRTLLVGAHLDSVEAGPGVNDNGSGSAFVLELALQMAELGIEPANRVQFAWWGAEELGLHGSGTYFHDDNGDLAPEVEDVEAYLNFDMLASGNGIRKISDGDGSTFDDGVQTDGSAVIEEHFESYFADLGLATRPEMLLAPTDSRWPVLFGIPSGGVFSGAFEIKSEGEVADFGGEAGLPHDPCYHLACDTFDNTNPVLFTELAKAGAHVAEILMQSDTPLVRGEFRRSSVIDHPRPIGCHDHVSWDR